MINHCDTIRNNNQLVGCFSALISLSSPKDYIKEGSVSGIKSLHLLINPSVSRCAGNMDELPLPSPPKTIHKRSKLPANILNG